MCRHVIEKNWIQYFVLACNRFIPFSRGRGVVAGANPSCLWAKAGYTLDKSPAHRGARTDAANWPGGARIWTSGPSTCSTHWATAAPELNISFFWNKKEQRKKKPTHLKQQFNTFVKYQLFFQPAAKQLRIKTWKGRKQLAWLWYKRYKIPLPGPKAH